VNVLFLVPYPTDGPSNRLRVEQYLPWLREQGVTARVRPFMSPALYRVLYEPGQVAYKITMTMAGVAKRLADLVRAARADVVVIHREAWPFGTALLERLIARVCPAMVFDFDDAIYLNGSSKANPWTSRFRSARKTEAILGVSAQVIAGNRLLQTYALRYNPHVTVIPTPVDTQRYRCRSGPGRAGKIVIGWMGTHTTAAYLQMLQRPLAALVQRYPQVEVRVVGAGRHPLALASLRTIRWELARELEELHQFDIGLMPMPDDEWTRGKCGFKALLYMSVGIPVVASPVGSNMEIIRDGVNGFLATNEEEWTDRLSRLIDAEGLRTRLGLAGRATVEERYSVRANAPRLLRVLEQARQNGRASA